MQRTILILSLLISGCGNDCEDKTNTIVQYLPAIENPCKNPRDHYTHLKKGHYKTKDSTCKFEVDEHGNTKNEHD